MPSTPTLQHARHRVSVLIAGQRVEAASVRHDSVRYQDLLQTAKARFGSALCECSPQPLHLVIRERNGKLFLACWPDQAQHHALDCPFYQARDESARAKYPPEAIADDGQAFHLRLHHPVTRRAGENRSAHKGTDAVHIWGLLHHLWEEGGLNRWHPGWTRDWGRVRWLLRRVAQSTYLSEDVPLIQRMYVPPIWSAKRKDSIDADWLAFKRPLLNHNRSRSVVESGFVFGLVRGLEPSTHGYSIRLQHHGERFYLDKQVADMLASYSRRGWSALRVASSEKNQPQRVLAALRIQATSNGTLVIVEGALMRVSRDFIPVASNHEETVATSLVEESRAFVKPLHYDLHRHTLPHFILTDCANGNPAQDKPDRTCLFVYGTNHEAHHLRRLMQDDEAEAKARGCAVWKWMASDTDVPPPFPPRWARPDGASSTSIHQEQ